MSMLAKLIMMLVRPKVIVMTVSVETRMEVSDVEQRCEIFSS